MGVRTFVSESGPSQPASTAPPCAAAAGPRLGLHRAQLRPAEQHGAQPAAHALGAAHAAGRVQVTVRVSTVLPGWPQPPCACRPASCSPGAAGCRVRPKVRLGDLPAWPACPPVGAARRSWRCWSRASARPSSASCALSTGSGRRWVGRCPGVGVGITCSAGRTGWSGPPASLKVRSCCPRRRWWGCWRRIWHARHLA